MKYNAMILVVVVVTLAVVTLYTMLIIGAAVNSPVNWTLFWYRPLNFHNLRKHLGKSFLFPQPKRLVLCRELSELLQQPSIVRIVCLFIFSDLHCSFI